MELSFVISAIRRYLWVPLVCALLGALAGFGIEIAGVATMVHASDDSNATIFI